MITMTEQQTHDLNFQSGKIAMTLTHAPIRADVVAGMLTSWNKLCFTTGYIEVRLSLPGSGNVPGLWPGVWTMGNLGRAGFGATTEGQRATLQRHGGDTNFDTQVHGRTATPHVTLELFRFNLRRTANPKRRRASPTNRAKNSPLVLATEQIIPAQTYAPAGAHLKSTSSRLKSMWYSAKAKSHNHCRSRRLMWTHSS